METPGSEHGSWCRTGRQWAPLTLHSGFRVIPRAMIVVAGTMRSGTSLWMQILAEAGYRFIGDRFPRTWEQALRDANPNGFYESVFRTGINFQTNPHPRTNRYLRPEQSRSLLVKVFPSGVARSDVAFLDKVVVTIRPWRSVVRSIRKMRALEAQVWGWREKGASHAYPLPEVEWIVENFLLARDLRLRGYPHVVHGHGQLMRDPARTIGDVLTFLEGPVLETPRLAKLVDTSLNRSTAPEAPLVHQLDPSIVAGLDRWVENVEAGRWEAPDGIEALEEAWKYLHREHLMGQRYPWDHPLLAGEPG